MKTFKWKKKDTKCEITDDFAKTINIKGLISDLKRIPTLEEYLKR